MSDSKELDYGRKMPQAIELEEAVLGAILIDMEALKDCLPILSVNQFYKEAHQTIFSAISELSFKRKPVDITTVAQILRDKGMLQEVGGAYYLSYLTNRVASSANAKHYSHIIIEKSVKRDTIIACTEIIKSAYDDVEDAFDLVDKFQSKSLEISHNIINATGPKSVKDLIPKLIEKVDKIASMEVGKTYGINTGFDSLNKFTDGWQRGDLIVWSGPPGSGKTSIVVDTVVKSGMKSLFQSLEMEDISVVERMVAESMEIPTKKFYRNLRVYEKTPKDDLLALFNKATDKIYDSKLYIDDQGGLNISRLVAKAKNFYSKIPVEERGSMVVDYLGLMGTDDIQQKQYRIQLGVITSRFKQLAKELEIPIHLLVQMSRDYDKRGKGVFSKRPRKTDLRESGTIEQNADMIIMLFRPEYFYLTDGIPESQWVWDERYDHKSCKDQLELIVEKHRNGAMGHVLLNCNMATYKFWDEEEDSGFRKIEEPIEHNQLPKEKDDWEDGIPF